MDASLKMKEGQLVSAYHETMPAEAMLPDEAPDMTVSELHAWAVLLLREALITVFGDSALVLSEIFLRVPSDGPRGADQVSPDLLVVPGARIGKRTVYRVPEEPVPSVTVEILSEANRYGQGRADLEHKRYLLGRVGVPTHIEIDPEAGTVVVWRNTGSRLVPSGPVQDSYDGPELGGIRLALMPGGMRVWLPDGREYLGAAAETVRADTQAARADRLEAQADYYLRLLQEHGIQPDDPDHT